MSGTGQQPEPKASQAPGTRSHVPARHSSLSRAPLQLLAHAGKLGMDGPCDPRTHITVNKEPTSAKTHNCVSVGSSSCSGPSHQRLRAFLQHSLPKALSTSPSTLLIQPLHDLQIPLALRGLPGNTRTLPPASLNLAPCPPATLQSAPANWAPAASG